MREIIRIGRPSVPPWWTPINPEEVIAVRLAAMEAKNKKRPAEKVNHQIFHNFNKHGRYEETESPHLPSPLPP